MQKNDGRQEAGGRRGDAAMKCALSPPAQQWKVVEIDPSVAEARRAVPRL